MNFKNKVLKVVKKIPAGKFLTYKKVAQKIKNPLAYRAVANILAKNKDPKIPCHRVIKNNYLVGGYKGSEKKSLIKAGLLLKEGAIGVIPTDTIYGICTNALNKKAVEKIYKLKKRTAQKPVIILISSLKDLKIFNIKLNQKQKIFLKKIWPSKISVVLPSKSKKFFYLHRGKYTLAFRLPKPSWLLNLIKISGPIIAPSANFEDKKPAKNISQAKKYFKNKVFYYDKGDLISKPSTLIKINNKKIEVLRIGADYKKIINYLAKSADFKNSS
jgi:L-threonylcarbamoyladenylate synthase